ncbi:S8 family peptidase [Cupriavidus basilensis]|uniref:S8 family peptidase n=1 Tax=Cupriavidus basilensis TaxID=68895 RepID=UPI001F505A2B|nr:S8 family peptidase [Cupriavidus basilensis]
MAFEEAREALGLPERRGMSIAVEFSPRGAFDYGSVEWKRDGIELLTVLAHVNSDVAVLHVPDGKLSAFVKRVTEYIELNNPKGTAPKNASLVNAIDNIRRAAFAELWTDTAEPPDDIQPHWFQIWLRHTSGSTAEVVDQFREQAVKVEIQVEPGYVSFPGRVVVAALGTRAALEHAAELLDLVAEIRLIEPNAEFFLSELTPAEQADWIQDLLDRTTFTVGDDVPHVCILDTGINRGHPLLGPALDVTDTHTYDPAWHKDDHAGHGSEMAGIALYGDLTVALNTQEELEIPHRLESVKILPPEGQTPPRLWGAITAESVGRVEVEAADRPRVFAMMTTSVGHLLGAPSEWSATIDQLAFGRAPVDITDLDSDDDDAPWVSRLFVLSAGNVEWQYWNEYPETNARSPVQNPGQSWNALTVGAATTLTQIDTKKYGTLTAIAASGHLSPASTTSVLWTRSAWPFKPDVVAEGGNGSLDGGIHVTVGPESLRVLTTSSDPTGEPFAASGDTSAAAAEVARICAYLRARYPQYWPETIRGLIVHGADHTEAMRATLPDETKRADKEQLLRTFGYGMVNAAQSEYSTAHRPTLVIQRQFNPYHQKENGSIVLGEMQLHDLPWPVEELQRLGAAQVELRITLSYFVEPNPSSRGWQSKFRYQSYALRFAVKAATEDDDQFKRRINKLERVPEEDAAFNDPDVGQWRYGAQLRARGSLHSDIWTGTAAQLGSKSKIAVFPVGGWWKDWKEAKQYDSEARYSLIVSLRASDDIDTDIYAPIAAIVEQEAVIAVDVDVGSTDADLA